MAVEQGFEPTPPQAGRDAIKKDKPAKSHSTLKSRESKTSAELSQDGLSVLRIPPGPEGKR